mmetsp:Transcript_30969/g.43373  ORF Transcript_30969/g.43373 Transcript_30969/m.43373 type:complete len:103 (+) Transcript_30969:170-478(+)
MNVYDSGNLFGKHASTAMVTQSSACRGIEARIYTVCLGGTWKMHFPPALLSRTSVTTAWALFIRLAPPFPGPYRSHHPLFRGGSTLQSPAITPLQTSRGESV